MKFWEIADLIKSAEILQEHNLGNHGRKPNIIGLEEGSPFVIPYLETLQLLQ